MSRTKRVRITVEGFEDRLTPSISAVVDGGSLRLTGTAVEPSHVIHVNQVAAGKFQVFDGTAQIGGDYVVSKDVFVSLTKANDLVEMNLGGFAAPGNITANLGDGDNRFRLNGVAGTTAAVGSAKSLGVLGGAGKDDVAVSNFSTPGVLYLNTGGGADLAVTDGRVYAGELNVVAAEGVTVGANTGVVRSTNVSGGTGRTTAVLSGQFGGPATIVSQTGPLTVTAGGKFLADLTVYGVAPATASGDGSTVTLGGSVAGQFTVRTGAGADTVGIALGASVGKAAVISTGDGSDVVTIAGTVGPAGATSRVLTVETGGGDDRVELAGGAKVSGEAFVNLGAGADRFTLSPNAVFNRLTADGGEGKDTFAGDAKHAGLTLLGFEVFV